MNGMEMLVLENPEEIEDDTFWEYNPQFERKNPSARKAMKIAGKLRSEGYDASTALSEAWSQVRGKRKTRGNMLLDNPTQKNMLFIAAAVIAVAIIAARLAQGHWVWQGMGKKQLTAPVTSRALVPTQSPLVTEPGLPYKMTFNDSGLKVCSESDAPSGETVATIWA